MEILEILKNSSDEIYPEDLDFFETELAIGDYRESYIAECKAEIKLIRQSLNGEMLAAIPSTKRPHSKQPLNSPRININISNQSAKQSLPINNEDNTLVEICTLRDSDNYKTKFKNYVRSKENINQAFLEEHYSFFLAWEINTIISIKEMDEEFLEKYFNTLDADVISRYQYFSESFFMKHYAQLNTKIVLTKGKNSWRKKENRSKQLDIFLRLKGVKM